MLEAKVATDKSVAKNLSDFFITIFLNIYNIITLLYTNKFLMSTIIITKIKKCGYDKNIKSSVSMNTPPISEYQL